MRRSEDRSGREVNAATTGFDSKSHVTYGESFAAKSPRRQTTERDWLRGLTAGARNSARLAVPPLSFVAC
ncbi:MAG: hypothetical protein RL701_3654 [Pseudomonadota bacterium]